MKPGPVVAQTTLRCFLLLLGTWLSCSTPCARATGYWTALANPAPGSLGVNLMLLLPDGTVMAAENSGTSTNARNWFRLKPNSQGSYTNGTWTTLSPMNDSRKFFASQVLPNGKVLVAGGEYGSGGPTAELYDIASDYWTGVNPPASLLDPSKGDGIVDASSMLLTDGRVLVDPVSSSTNYPGSTLLFDPKDNTWSLGSAPGLSLDEASWVKLADGSIITIAPIVTDAKGVSWNGFGTNAFRFVPGINEWVQTASVPTPMYATLPRYFGETGPGLLLPNGSAFFIGGRGHTAIYTPTGATTGTWMAGPDLPGGLVSADAPAVMMPNGKILCAAAPAPSVDSSGNLTFPGPTTFYEYDYTDTSHGTQGWFTRAGTFTDNESSFLGAMLMLPDGTVLFSHMATDLYIYHPDAPTTATGKPTIQSITANANGTYTLTGTGLNGISAGAAYGDDLQMDSSYPLVRITSGGDVSYARTFNWTSTGVMTGTNLVSTDFVLSSSVPPGSTLQVVANGIASDPVAFNPLFLAFKPLTNTQTVFDFSQLGGTVNEAATVTFRIQQYDAGGYNDLYWNGSSWIANGNDPSVYLPATVSGGVWFPANGVTLPSRAQTRYGPYFLRALATDTRGNSATNEILVTRSAQDTTLPTVTLDAIASGQVITNNFLPDLFGTAADPESGIASVTVYLMRLVSGNFLYWDGGSWTANPTALTANYSSSTWQFNGTLPSGASLPKGSYQVQVSAVNGENPAGTRVVGVAFTVDYHPVYYWTAGSYSDSDPYNNNNSWGDPANWSPYGVPSADAIVFIDGSAPAWPDNTPLGSVTIYGVNLSGGGLVTAGMFVHKLNVSGGTLSGGAVNIDGNGGVFNWTGGTLAGTYGVLAGAVMNVSGSLTKVLNDGAMLVNQGTTTWAGGGTINANGYGADSVITNTPGAVFALAGDGSVFAQNNGYHTIVFHNPAGARVVKTAGTNSLISICTFNNAGEVRCDSGKLDFNANLNLAPGTGFSGSGTNRVISGTVAWTGTATVTNSTLELAGGTLTGAADHSATLATVGSGRFLWSGGWCYGTLTLAAGSVSEIRSGGATVMGDGAVLNNLGSLTWFGGPSLIANGYGAPSYINNLPGAVFTLAGDGSLFAQYNGYWTMVLSNAPGARVTKTLGANSLIGVCTFNNAGEVNCSSGELDLNASLNLSSGSRFAGSGTTRVTGGTLVLTGTTMVADTTLELAGGEFHGADDQSSTWATTGTGKLLWSAAWMYGTVTVAANTDLRIGGSQPAALADGAVLNNHGNIQWLGSAPIYVRGYSAPSYITNAPGATFTFAADGTAFAQYNGYYTVIFNNVAGARLSKTSGTNTVLGVSVLNNAGELRCDTGVLAYNSTLNLNGGGTLTGAGTHRVTAGSLLVTGSTTVAGPVLELANGSFQGAVDGSGTFLTSGAGRVLWSGGGLYNTLTLGTNALGEIGGTADKYFSDGAVLESHGNLTWSAGRLMASGYSTESFIRNRPGAVFTITSTNAADHFNGYHAGQFENNAGAQLVWNPPGECAWPGWALVNDGVTAGQGGRLTLGSGGASSGLFTNGPGAELRFIGGNFAANDGTSFRGSGLTRISGAALTASGNVSANLTGTGAGFLFDAGSINGATFSSLGQFIWNGGTIWGTVSNAPGGQMILAGGSSMVMGDGAVVWNAGSAQLTLGPLLSHGYSGDAFWYNQPGGVFGITADGSAFGLQNGYHWLIFNNSPGARLVKLAGTNSLVDSCLVDNSGELRSDSGILAFSTSVNLNPGGTVTGTGRIALQGGGVTGNGTTTIQGGTLGLSGATLTGNSNAVLSAAGGLFDWSGGTLAGTVSLAAGGNYQLSGAGVKVLADGAVLNNGGTLTVSGTGSVIASGYSGDSTVNNQAGGTIQLSADASWGRYNSYHAALLNNSGTLALDSAPHLFQMNWDFVQSSAGTLKVALAGTAPGSGYSRLAANTVSLSGTLNVALAGGFTPASTNTFDVVTYGSESGQFSTVAYPPLSGGRTWAANYGPNAVTLSVVQPNLLSLVSSNGHFQVVSSGPPGAAAVLFSSSDLTTWQPVATNAPFSGTFTFDVQPSGAPRAFFKVKIAPVGGGQ